MEGIIISLIGEAPEGFELIQYILVSAFTMFFLIFTLKLLFGWFIKLF